MASFSICVPAYNCGNTIFDCIESVLQQNYTNWEVIIVDDGSSNETARTLDSIAAQNRDRVSVVHTENKGPYLARQIAFGRARNDYILCLDSDDLFMGNDVLSSLNKVAEKYSPDLVMFNGTADLKSKKKFVDYSGIANEKFAHVSKNRFRLELIKSYKLNNLAFKMIRTSILKSSPKYNGRLTMAEDRFQVLQIADAISSIYVIDQLFYYYKPSANSTTHSEYRYEYFEQACIVEELSHKLAVNWGVPINEWSRLFQAISYGAVRAIRETVRPYRKRAELYRKILNSPCYQYAVQVTRNSDGRCDRKIGNLLLKNEAFPVLDVYLIGMVLLLRFLKLA